MPLVTFEEFQTYTTAFIDEISQQIDDSTPTTRIIEIETLPGNRGEFTKKFSPTEKFVKQPSKKYDEFFEFTIDHFRELAGDVIEPPPEPVVPDLGQRIHSTAVRYGDLAWKVMDYEGDFSYSDSSLQGVWDDHFEENDEQFFEYRIIIPFLNFVGTGESVTLALSESNVHPHEEVPFPAEDIAISELTDDELSALMTYEGLRIGDDIGIQPSSLSYNLPHYKLEIVFRSEQYADFGLRSVRTGVDVVSGRGLFEKANTVGKQVVTALHLFDVDAKPYHGLSYLVYDDWRTHRENIRSVDIYRDWMEGYSPTITDPRYRGGNFELTSTYVDEIEEFWIRYHSIIGDCHDFDEAFYRFSQMFKGPAERDDIVDSAIAFESLLTVGRDWGTISTTIALHGSVLLDSRSNHDRRDLWRFFKNVYSARSKIVHNGMKWDDIVADDDLVFQLMDDSEPTLDDFVDTTREILSKTLIAYMDNKVDSNLNLGRVNEKIFDAIRAAKY